MDLLRTRKYPVKNPVLKNVIKYFWVIQSDHPVTINHKLLPVSNIDIIMNFSPEIKYVTDDKTEIIPKKFHFNGIRDRCYYIHQDGLLNVFGISFYPAGLYPLLKTPLFEFTNQTIELDMLINDFTSQIEEELNMTDSIQEKFNILERELIRLINIDLIPMEINQVLDAFYLKPNYMDINLFCEQYGINQRTLERLFKKYIGINPKLFLRLKRFQAIINEIISGKNTQLVSLTYENEYYDQTHFIKDFKSFTGCPPSQFLNEKSTVKEILTYS